MSPLATLKVLNPLLQPRTSTFQTVAPFARGAVRDVSMLTVEGAEAVDMEPFGKRWDDGSVRMARVWARVAMLAGQSWDFPVVEGTRPAAARAESVPISFPIREVGQYVITNPFNAVGIGGASFPWGRCWTNWHFRHDMHQPVIHFALTVGYSEPQRPDLWVELQDPIEIVLHVGDGVLSVPHGAMKGARQRIVAEHQITTFLPAGTRIAHGQAHGWQGVFMSPAGLWIQESKPLIAIATNWNDCGIGPLVRKVLHPAWMPDPIHVRVACERKINDRNARPPNDPYYEPKFGLGKTSAETGAQDDFGVIHGNAGFLGQPEWLDLAVPDALQEWCRPTHFREADGRPVTSAAHPLLNMWMGRPHEAGTVVSPDQLGKPAKNVWSAQQRAEFDVARKGWEGMDPQHTSLLLLTTAAMQTGDYQLCDLLSDYAETYLASYTLPSTHPHHFSSGMDAARAVGRTGYTSSWLDLVLDRGDVRGRANGRVGQVVLPAWTATAGKVVRPIDITERVNLDRYLAQNGTPLPVQPKEWHPWQEGIAIYGLLCIHATTGSIAALEIAQGIGETLVMHGWEDRSTYWKIAKALEWTGDPVQVGGTDRKKFLNSDDTDYSLWNIAAIEWLAANATKPEVRDRATVILRGWGPQRPTDDFFSTYDRYSLGGQ